MIAIAYLCALLFIIVFTLYLLNLSIKKCPVKIKFFYGISLSVILIRYISLLFSWLIEKQGIIYFIKPITKLNFISIPLLSLAALYIFLRDEKRTFNYNYIFMIILAVGYLFITYIYKLDIKIDTVFGFIIEYKDILTPSLIYLIIVSSIAVITLLFIDKPFSNSVGMKLLMFSLMLLVTEFIVFLGGIRIFPYPLLGEYAILLCSYKAINTFK